MPRRGGFSFVVIDEASSIPALTMADKRTVRQGQLVTGDTKVGKTGPYVSALELECPWCGAQKYESCRNSPTDQRLHGVKHVHGLHGARIKDADLATQTMRTLLDED